MIRKAKLLLGVLLKDVPIYAAALWGPGQQHLRARNRAERLLPGPDGAGYKCDWKWTSELHAPKHVPALGMLLLRRALELHPIGLGETPRTGLENTPAITFLIGHRGSARLPHLLATLRSIAAQEGADVECIVVEQDEPSQLRQHLPSWVRWVHTPPPAMEMPYCRSWAFNVGARHARAPVLVLHDNDMLVPTDYAAQILRRVAQGYEVINPKRFIFYMNQFDSQRLCDDHVGLGGAVPETIVQNLEAGGSVSITRSAYDRIGGMDESFVGWGGEDNEFWDRAQALRVWSWGYSPLVHLWHAPQPGKRESDSETAKRYQALSAVDPTERIDRLRSTPFGLMQGPRGWHRTLPDT